MDEATARTIEGYRRTSGKGLVGALAEFGIFPFGADDPSVAVERGGPYSPLLIGAVPARELTFDSFIRCKANDFPRELGQALAARPDHSPYSPLYVYSEVGLGKTHLLSAIAHAAGTARALLVNTADLDVEVERAAKLGAAARLRRVLCEPAVLLLDDVQFCEGRPALQHEIVAVMNYRARNGLALAISSDVPPTRLANVETRLVSRFRGGVIVGLGVPEEADRVAIVRGLPGAERLPDDVVVYLARRITDSVRHLRGAAAQLLAAAELGGIELSVKTARTLLPMVRDLQNTLDVLPEESGRSEPASEAAQDAAAGRKAEQFKRMLASAETEQEQILALEIALGAGLRELRMRNGPLDKIERLERSLELLREGELDKALAGLK